jgi:hypothetical protein
MLGLMRLAERQLDLLRRMAALDPRPAGFRVRLPDETFEQPKVELDGIPMQPSPRWPSTSCASASQGRALWCALGEAAAGGGGAARDVLPGPE